MTNTLFAESLSSELHTLFARYSASSAAPAAASAHEEARGTRLYPLLSCRALGLSHTPSLLSRLLAALHESLRADSQCSASDESAQRVSASGCWELTVATGYLNPPHWLLERLSSLLRATTWRAHMYPTSTCAANRSGTERQLSAQQRAQQQQQSGRAAGGAIDEGSGAGARVRVVAASPRTNGWHGAHGFSALVTAFYNRLQLGLEPRLRGALYEWDSDTYSFHAKGVWLMRPPPSSTSSSFSFAAASYASASVCASSSSSSASSRLPSMFVVGSSNYGERSTRRDLEFDLLLVSREPRICSLFARELGTLLPPEGTMGNPVPNRVVPIHRALIEQRIRSEPLWKRAILRTLTRVARSFLSYYQ